MATFRPALNTQHSPSFSTSGTLRLPRQQIAMLLRRAMHVCFGWQTATIVGLTLGLAYGLTAVSTVQNLGGLEQWARKADFLSVLTGATILAQNDGAHLYDQPTQQAAQSMLLRQVGNQSLFLLPYNHPPFEALLVQHVRTIVNSDGGALLVWTFLSIAAIGATIYLMSSGWPAVARQQRVFVLAVCSFFPLLTSLLLGQSTAFMLLGLAGCTIALRRGNDGWAGAALCLTALKPQTAPLLLLALLIARRWRALLSFSGVTISAIVLTMPVLGWQWPIHYMQLLLRMAMQPSGPVLPPIEQNWQGFVSKMPLPSSSAALLTVTLILVSVSAVVWAWLQAPRHDTDANFDRRWSLTVFAALLVDPHLLPHDLALALVPGAALLAIALAHNDMRLLAWLWVGWGLAMASALYRGPLPPFVVLWEAITASWLCWTLRLATAQNKVAMGQPAMRARRAEGVLPTHA